MVNGRWTAGARDGLNGPSAPARSPFERPVRQGGKRNTDSPMVELFERAGLRMQRELSGHLFFYWGLVQAPGAIVNVVFSQYPVYWHQSSKSSLEHSKSRIEMTSMARSRADPHWWWPLCHLLFSVLVPHWLHQCRWPSRCCTTSQLGGVAVNAAPPGMMVSWPQDLHGLAQGELLCARFRPLRPPCPRAWLFLHLLGLVRFG